MIDRQEIMEFARELSLAPNVVEKDYALGWLFKGGTCLKKCYFETYRFSEDLDFTLLHDEHIQEDFLLTTFQEVAEWVYEQSGMEIPRDTISFEVYINLRGKPAVEGRIGYRGPMGMRGSLPRIKLDLTADECVTCEPLWRDVHHPYTDQPKQGTRSDPANHSRRIEERHSSRHCGSRTG